MYGSYSKLYFCICFFDLNQTFFKDFFVTQLIALVLYDIFTFKKHSILLQTNERLPTSDKMILHWYFATLQ